MAGIDTNQPKLTRGQVTFVPACNPRAYKAGARCVDRNLNRYLAPMESPDCYEAQIGNVLCPLLEGCDVLLDLHSYTAGGASFVFIDNQDNREEYAFAASLGVDVIMSGWTQTCVAMGQGSAKKDNESAGTTEYARRFGAIAVTLECGQHKEPNSVEIAYRALRNALRHCGLVTKNPDEATAAATPRHIVMTHVYYQDDGGVFTKAWRNFEKVAAGEIIAIRGNGEKLRASKDSVIIMPKATAVLGEEWFYFGVERPTLA